MSPFSFLSLSSLLYHLLDRLSTSSPLFSNLSLALPLYVIRSPDLFPFFLVNTKAPLHLYILPFPLFILARFSLAIHYFHIFILLLMFGLLLLALESQDLSRSAAVHASDQYPGSSLHDGSATALASASCIHSFTAHSICPRRIDMPLSGCFVSPHLLALLLFSADSSSLARFPLALS